MMQVIRIFANYFAFLFVLILCLTTTIQAQDQDQNDIQYLEGELYQRALHFSIDQLNRAIEIGNRAVREPDPERRTRLYEDMMGSLNDAKRMFRAMESKPREYEYIPDLIQKHWANEHNTGADLLNKRDFTDSDEVLYRDAIIHFNNAIYLQPDSAHSYIALATLKLDQGEFADAIDFYELGMERLDQPGIEDYEILINLYFSQNQLNQVRDLTQIAITNYPEELKFTQYLADYHLESGNNEEASKLIRELLEKDNERPEYYFALGSIYQNEAAELFQRRDLTSDLDKKIEYDESARIVLMGAMDKYEIAVDLDPDNQGYWKTLYQVYSALGIHHKADLAYEKAGIDQ
jgi:Tfp pilus assembly protein PilF